MSSGDSSIFVTLSIRFKVKVSRVHLQARVSFFRTVYFSGSMAKEFSLSASKSSVGPRVDLFGACPLKDETSASLSLLTLLDFRFWGEWAVRGMEGRRNNFCSSFSWHMGDPYVRALSESEEI